MEEANMQIYYAIIQDILLALGFGIVHSCLASFKSKELGKKILPAHLYRIVFSITIAAYILFAAYYWKEIDYLVYSIPAPYSYILTCLVIIGWGMYFYSHLFYYEVGGVFGTSQLFSRSPLIGQVRFDYSTNGLKRYIRFPVHTAFFLIFLAIPTMYVSTLIFAIISSLYAWLGTIHHDYRYKKLFKNNNYIAYMQNSGMVLPRFKNYSLLKYDNIIYDSTPRKKALPLIALCGFIAILFSLITILKFGDYLLIPRMDLIYIPLLTMAIGTTSIFIALLFLRRYQFTPNANINFKNSECVAFGAGVTIAITLGCINYFEYFFWNALPNLSAVIPAWVLSILMMHLTYFGFEYCVLKISNKKQMEVFNAFTSLHK
jgi:hypothetical protein